MNSRELQTRCEWDGILGEWEASDIKVRHLSDKEVTELVRKLNKESKAVGSVIRYRSVEDSSGKNW